MKKEYFGGLNYTLGNEDTAVEIALVKKYKPKKICAVCGSGGRSLALLHDEVLDLTVIDLSPEQLFLAELRLATYQKLSYEDFLSFWQYSPLLNDDGHKKRENIFNSLTLTTETRKYFQNIFNEINFGPILYIGKWERTFRTFSKIVRLVLGKSFDEIFKFKDLSQQAFFYQNTFPMKRWNILIYILGNKAVFNTLLYKGNFVKKNSPLSYHEYYTKAFNHLFTKTLARENFFLQLSFFGKIQFETGIPVEASLESFLRIKKNKIKINFKNEDLINYLSKGSVQYDFLSLSDVPSYFSSEIEINFMELIKPSLNPGAIVINRYYLREPKCKLENYCDITGEYKIIIELEKVQMYDIKIYQYKP